MATQSKVKKGISFSTDTVVENKLKFKPRVNEYNLCRGILASVVVEMKEVPRVKEDGSENTSEFAGTTVPNLVFRFKQTPTPEDPAERWFEKRYNLTATRSKDGINLERDVVEGILTTQMHQIIHILNAYKRVKGITIPKKDFNLDAFAPVAERIEDFTTFYQFVVDSLTGDDAANPTYATVQMWIKLVADYRTEAFYDIPRFIGTGFIELYQKGIRPAIEISPKETVELKKSSSKTKAISNGAMSESNEEEDPEIAKLLAKHSS